MSTNYEAIKALSMGHLEKFLDQVFLTGFNSGHQSLVDPCIDDECPYTSDWLNKDVEESPFLVESEKGEALIIKPLADVIMCMAEFSDEQMPDNITWEPLIIVPHGEHDETLDSQVNEPVNEYGISTDFEGDFDSWVALGKPDDKRIIIGTTSLALQSIGICERKIVWNTSKINIIQRKHSDMTDDVLRQVPNIIGNPIIVMESVTRGNRITVYGEVYNNNGIPVMVALELLPSGRRSRILLDTIRIASAYTREGDIPAVQNLISNSSILYICPDKERTDTWLSRNQLQLPFGITKYGSLGNVTYFERNVNGNIEIPGPKLPVPEWKEKLKDIDAEGGDEQ